MLPGAEVVVVLRSMDEVEDDLAELVDNFDVVRVVEIDEILVSVATDVVPGMHWTLGVG